MRAVPTPPPQALSEPPQTETEDQSREPQHTSAAELIIGGIVVQAIGVITATVCFQSLGSNAAGDRIGYYIFLCIGSVAAAAGTLAATAGVIRWGVQPLIDQNVELLEVMRRQQR